MGASQNFVLDDTSLPAVKALASHITVILEDYRADQSKYKIGHNNNASPTSATSLQTHQPKPETKTPAKSISSAKTKITGILKEHPKHPDGKNKYVPKKPSHRR